MTDHALLSGSVSALRQQLRDRAVSSEELTRACLDRIEACNGALNAVITVCAEQAIDSAREADKAIASGEFASLTGIPLLHKDIFCTNGVRTTCGSRMLEQFVPAYDATVVSKMRAEGAVMLGKCNMDEFAMGSSNETSFFGAVKNPWDLNCVPGGSSGGSAAALAAGMAPLVTGTDTGGSIRQPASLCGVTGLKPTYGRVSRLGIIAFASSLDQAGPMARSVEDCALMLGSMAGFDAKDTTSVDRPVPDYTAELGAGVEVQRRIMIGAYVLSAGYYDAYYNKARRVRSLIARDFTEAFEQVDAILTPTTPSPAFGITEEPSGVEMYMNDVFTVPASMAGIPGISLPAGLSSDGLPLGVQLLGRPFDEVGLLRVAQALEDAAGFTATPQLMA